MHRICNPKAAGSIPAAGFSSGSPMAEAEDLKSLQCGFESHPEHQGSIAQWLVQGTHNPKVPGSSPGRPIMDTVIRQAQRSRSLTARDLQRVGCFKKPRLPICIQLILFDDYPLSASWSNALWARHWSYLTPWSRQWRRHWSIPMREGYVRPLYNY